MTFYGFKVVGIIRRVRKEMAFGILWVLVVLGERKRKFLREREHVFDE